jgi:hypothetical protein
MNEQRRVRHPVAAYNVSATRVREIRGSRRKSERFTALFLGRDHEEPRIFDEKLA